MAEAHEIVAKVLKAFDSLADKLARITGKHAEWFRSHGREPKTHNPSSSGNVSGVTHFMQLARQYEAADRGAGAMLNNRVHAELDMEFSENLTPEMLEQKQLHAGVLKESFDVLDCLNKHDFKTLNAYELTAMEEEGAQLRDKASDYVSHVRAIRRIKESKKDF